MVVHRAHALLKENFTKNRQQKIVNNRNVLACLFQVSFNSRLNNIDIINYYTQNVVFFLFFLSFSVPVLVVDAVSEFGIAIFR